MAFQKKLVRSWWPFHALLLVCVILMVVLSNSVGKLPPLGPLLSPFTGFWQNKPFNLQSKKEVFNWPELKEPVEVQWDEKGVPHIFAQNSQDLFRVQGYVHARHRLFQMDITARAGEGRLSEIIGDKTLPTDIFFVKLGMREAVNRAHQAILGDEETREALQSYSDGVNRWIESLSPADYPIEYKMLNAVPREWSPRLSAAIYMVMTFRLSGRTYDLFLTKHVQKLGWKKIQALFPEFYAEQMVVPYPEGKNTLVKGAKPKINPEPFISQLKLDFAKEYIQPFATNGSNNWAISASRSKDGHAWVANDTHLNYSLPSIFYEQQLISPEFNIYGATIIGSAGLQIGFSPEFGWAVTNGVSDVLDWYEIQFDEDYGDKYSFNGEMIDIEKKDPETIVSKSGQNIQISQEWTKLGIIYSREKKLGLALRWMGHHTKNELKTFLRLTKAKNHQDCVDAIQFYHAPIQNLICATKDQLSIHHMGKAPKRIHPTGQLVKDGRHTDPDWEELIPYEEMPQTIDPKNGYVFSANQQITPNNFPYYMSWDWEESYRASQIDKELSKMSETVNFEEFRNLQGRVYNPHASDTLPFLVAHLKESDLKGAQTEALKDLNRWDYRALAKGWESSLFQEWWDVLEQSLYEKHFGPKDKNAWPKVRQSVAMLSTLLDRPEKVNADDYWFLAEGKNGEELKNIFTTAIGESFQKAWQNLTAQYGDDYHSWLWKDVHATTVNHLLKIPGFSEPGLIKDGGRYTVDINSTRTGAVWRHIVRIGDDFEAWTNFLGGPSGNPFAVGYSSEVEPWTKNEYKKVVFMKEPPKEVHTEVSR